MSPSNSLRRGSAAWAGIVRTWAPAALAAILIWLAWQILIGLLVQRAPIEVAVRVAPTSVEALSRASEAELVSGHPDQARDLALMALQSAPFDVRAVRVLGLTVDQHDPAAADALLTLAGNWSLRDDPAHSWLVERRLRQGNYYSAFGHADLLARRRAIMAPQLFELFTTAAAEDPRSRPALMDRLADNPNWRGAYLSSLGSAGLRGAVVQSVLATGLEASKAPLTDAELGAIYTQWFRDGRIAAILALRRQVLRPDVRPLQNGGFDGTDGPPPFGWALTVRPGLAVTIVARDDGKGSALFVESDGFRGGEAAVQTLTLAPGPWRLSAQARFEAGGEDARLEWRVVCVETGGTIAQWRPAAADRRAAWTAASIAFDVPPSGCLAQRLQLRSLGGTARTTIIGWFDDVRLIAGAG